MAERCNIAIKKEDGTILSIYCHDGYLLTAGQTLLDSYNTPDKILELMDLGYLSSLGGNTKYTVAYHRDYNREMDHADQYENISEYLNGKSMDEEFLFLWDGEWKFQEVHYNEKGTEDGFQSMSKSIDKIRNFNDTRTLMAKFLSSNLPERHHSEIFAIYNSLCGSFFEITADKCEEARTALNSLIEGNANKGEVLKYFNLKQIQTMEKISQGLYEYQEHQNSLTKSSGQER